MVLFQLKHGSHRGMILNVGQVIYFEPSGKALVYTQPTPVLQLDSEDWNRLERYLLRHEYSSCIRKLGEIDLSLLESLVDDS